MTTTNTYLAITHSLPVIAVIKTKYRPTGIVHLKLFSHPKKRKKKKRAPITLITFRNERRRKSTFNGRTGASAYREKSTE